MNESKNLVIIVNYYSLRRPFFLRRVLDLMIKQISLTVLD